LHQFLRIDIRRQSSAKLNDLIFPPPSAANDLR
jgi:hypothetical protein